MENGTSSEENVKVVRFKLPAQRYTKEALLELQNLSSSKVRPKFLDNFPSLDLELASKARKYVNLLNNAIFHIILSCKNYILIFV